MEIVRCCIKPSNHAGFRAIYSPLLREHAAKNCIEGSNPSVSAKTLKTRMNTTFCGFFLSENRSLSLTENHRYSP